MLKTLADSIGNTPLVKVSFNPSLGLYAKLEYLNPGGSVKDRSARFMIEDAEKRGILKESGTIVDASSGNHGIAIAMIGASKGYRVIIATSDKFSKEKLDTIKAYGAQIVICPATEFIEDPQSYHSTAKKLASEIPGSFMPDQYFNPLNAVAHYSDLGPEIWHQTEGKITHFFAAAGTCGTISGVGKYLKEKNSDVKVIAIDSINSYRSTNGNPKPYILEGVGIDFNTPVMNKSVIDEIIPVSDENALIMLRQLANKQGLMAGLSSAAVAHVAQKYMPKTGHNNIGVMIFGDSGRAYLSKNLY